VQELLEAVAAACRGVDGLQAAIVFGSAVVREDPADLDLALLWDDSLDARECWRRGNRVAGEVEHRLGRRALNVDVKDLRRLPLVLQHRVLRDGRVAYVADRRALVRFNSETVPCALDFLPFHRRALLAAARRLAR
jgi:predicted nucleotidyltransferase